MQNGKRVTFYILSASCAVLLVCFISWLLLLAFDREGRGAITASALDQDTVSDFMDSTFDIEVYGQNFGIFSLENQVTSSYVDSGDFSIIGAVNTVFGAITDAGKNVTALTAIFITFNRPSGFRFSEDSIFYFYQDNYFDPISLDTGNFGIEYRNGDSKSYGTFVDGTIDDGKLVDFYNYPPTDVPKTYDSIRINLGQANQYLDNGIFTCSLFFTLPGNFNVERTQLQTPVVKLVLNQLKWSAITGASGYRVYRNGSLYSELDADQTFYTITVSGYSEWQVQAVGDFITYSDSALSNTVVFGTAVKLDSPVLSLVDDKLTWTPVDNAYYYYVYRSDTSDGAYSLLYRSTGLEQYTLSADEVPGYFYVTAGSNSLNYEMSDPSNILQVGSLPDPNPDPDPDDPKPPIGDDPSPKDILSSGKWSAEGTWTDTSDGSHSFQYSGSSLSDFLTDDGYGIKAAAIYSYLESKLSSNDNYETIQSCYFYVQLDVMFTYDPVYYQFLWVGSPLGVSVTLYAASGGTGAPATISLYDGGFNDPYIVVPDYFVGSTVRAFGINFSGAYNSMSGTLYLFDYVSNIGFDFGYDQGYENGFTVGSNQGYDLGYDAALNSSGFMQLMTAVVDAPINAFMGLFDVEIMGFNIAGMLIAILSIALIVKVISLFM